MKGNVPDPELGPVIFDIRYKEVPLFLSFAGLGDQFQFRNLLGKHRVNVVYIRDLKHNWYLNGIPGLGETVQEVCNSISNLLVENNCKKLICIGASAGGFAAMLYGTLLQADNIVSFSPQSFMNKFNRLIHWDTRWADREREIYAGNKSNRAYLDLKNVIARYKGTCAVYYDDTHRLDRLHAARLKSEHVTLVPFKSGGHSLVAMLKENGQLELILNNLIV